MLGKRQTRGNVAIAALLFVTAIGVGAVALDSARVAINPHSQVAEPGSAIQKGQIQPSTEKQVREECRMGYDYVVRYLGTGTKKTLVVRPTLDGRTETTIEKGNQCPATVVVSTSGRRCDEQWKCEVTVCIPKEVTIKGTTEECMKMPPTYSHGQGFDNDLVRQDTAARIMANIEEAPPQRALEIASAVKAMDPAVGTSILTAFGDPEKLAEFDLQKEVYDRNKEANDAALAALTKCQNENFAYNLTGACKDYFAASDETAKRLAEEKAKYEKLAAQAAPLKELQKGLTATPEADPAKPAVNCPGGPNCPGGTWNKDKQELTKSTFETPPSGPGNPGGVTPGNTSPSSSGSMGDWMKMLGQALPLVNSLSNLFGGSGNAPTCTLRVSPTNITSPGQSVTLSWTTTNAQSAYLSNVGQVGPSGSMTVNPQQATTFSMQVTGYPQQQQQQQQQQGQFVYNQYTGQYQYVQAQQQPSSQGAAQQGQCQVQLTMGQGSGTDASTKPKAQISCQPKIADVGMQVSISYACQNANTSSGEGFSTSGQLSGSATTTVASPSLGSTTVTYGVTCSKDGVTDSAQCTTNVNKPSIVLVANPRDIDEGERTTIGWVTGAMDKCVISSPTLSDFTEENKGNTSVSGSVRTPALTRDTNFVLTCTTKAGTTKTAETTVRVDD